MDSVDLLARENEFKKLNKQLEKKTEQLMKEIEYTMQKQDVFSQFSNNLDIDLSNTKQNNHFTKSNTPERSPKSQNCSSVPLDRSKRHIHPPVVKKEVYNCCMIKERGFDEEFLYAFVEINVQENVLPQSFLKVDLLARENEFKKLNKQLEKKTEQLMKEIEYTMQKQDVFSQFSNNLDIDLSNTKQNNHFTKSNTPERSPKSQNCSSVPLDRSKRHIHPPVVKKEVYNCCMIKERGFDEEFLYAFVEINVQENVLPQSFLKDKPTVESLCKFLSSKVKLMQGQINSLQATIDKKASQCETHLSHHAELEGERMTLLNKNNNLRAIAADLKAKCMALQNRLDEKDRIYKEQRSLADKLSSDVKRLRAKNANVEAKCATQEQTIDNMRQQIDTAKRNEKEFRDSTRGLSASHQTTICRLEARVKSLSSCIDKQNSLIDNLRKQKAILSTEGALKALEKEYGAFLTKDF